MIVFDPFGDHEQRGYLRNHAGVKEKHLVSRLEHGSFSRSIGRALQYLEASSSITLADVRETHRILFSYVYPWAGQDRSQNAADLNITKGPVVFQPAPYVPQGVEYALNEARDPAAFRENPGKAIGELAFAHPFLDGNGRTITAVASELVRRAGVHIAWEETNKQDYLNALTKEIDDPKGRHLSNYLEPHIREGARSIEDTARVLTTLPGLSVPDAITQKAPTLTVVAGPNGAGKSTLTDTGAFNGLPVVDPDAIAVGLSPDNPASAAREAGRQALEMRRQLIDEGKSFVVETTMSGKSTLSLIDQAKANGFEVELKFIGLFDPEQAKTRIAGRVEQGGHNIPSDHVDRRFARGLENLPKAISKSDRVELYDNSEQDKLKLVARLSNERSQFIEAPGWATDAVFKSAESDLAASRTNDEVQRASNRALEAAKASGVSEEQIRQESRNLDRARQRKNDRGGHDL